MVCTGVRIIAEKCEIAWKRFSRTVAAELSYVKKSKHRQVYRGLSIVGSVLCLTV